MGPQVIQDQSYRSAAAEKGRSLNERVRLGDETEWELLVYNDALVTIITDINQNCSRRVLQLYGGAAPNDVGPLIR